MGVKGWATGSKGVKRYGFRVPACQGVGLQSPRGSRGRPSGSKGVNGAGLQGPRGSKGRPTGSKGVKEKA